jgi:hypothetical protein
VVHYCERTITFATVERLPMRAKITGITARREEGGGRREEGGGRREEGGGRREEGGGRREEGGGRRGCSLEAGGLRVRDQQSSKPRIKTGAPNAASRLQQ